MNLDRDKYYSLITNHPDAFAYHQIITDDNGNPVDYVFLEVNNAFEEMTGLLRNKIIGKKITEVLPDILKSGFDWIGTYGQVALSGKAVRFESLFEPIGRWYEVSAYSDEPGNFITVFRDISKQKKAEKALNDSKDLYINVFEKAPFGYQSLDEDGNFLMVNNAWLSILGYQKDEVIGKCFGDFLAPDYVVAFRERFPLYKEKGKIHSEFPMINKKGHQQIIEFKGVIDYKADGSFERTHCVLADITERMEAQKQLQYQLDITQSYLDITDTIMVTLDAVGNVTMLNRYGLELLEFEDAQIIGKNWFATVLPQPEGMEQVYPVFQRIMNGDLEPVSYFENDVISASGKRYTIAWRNNHLLNDKSEITGTLSSGLDITKRKKSEEALRESEQRAIRQRAAIADLFLKDTITAGEIVPAVKKITEIISSSVKVERVSIWVIDEKSEQLQCLDLYESSTGKHSNGDILHIKTFPSYFEAILEDSRISVANAQEDPKSRELNDGYLKRLGIASLLDAGIVVDGKLKGVISFEHVGDQRLWHVDEEAFASTIASMVGQLFVDAERKKTNEEIRKLNAELEQRVKNRTIELEAVNKELESFAHSISHDFRAPLRALNAFSASLTEKYNDQLDEQGLHYLNRIHKASLYMSDLVDDLLKLSRITRADMNQQEVDISQIAEEIVQDLQIAEPERQVKVEVAPGLSAKGDAALLKAALENLIGNAWKFSSQEVQAEIEIGQTALAGEKIFFIRDNGVGFNMAYADNLFGAFQRLHGIDEFPGTGIGLATVQRIINRHGGRIWAESEVGKGATFYFTLKS